MQFVLFPAEILALQQEVYQHPDLLEKLRNKQSKYVEDHIAEIALHLGIAVDADMDADAFYRFCTLLTDKLFEKRTLIILS